VSNLRIAAAPLLHLQERDLVNAALRRALTEDYGVSDTAIDEIINKRVGQRISALV
jgi:hypothetical protein